MPARRLAIAGLLLCLPLSLMPPAAMAQGDDDKSDAEAMARARRQAANPLRRILEAGSIKRRGPDVPAAAASAPAPLAAASAPPPKLSTAAPALAAPAPEPEPAIRVTVEPILPRQPAAAVPSAAASTPPVVATSVAPVRARLELPPPQLLTLARSPPPPAPKPEPEAPPQLIDMVEPAMSPRLLDELGRAAAVTADLHVQPDGSVGEVVLLTPTSRGVQRALLTAFSQWRFEPRTRPAVHRVELVFKR